jgi:hypothetical protein
VRLLASALLVAVFTPTPAHAGALGEVISGLGKAVGGGNKGGGAPSGGGGDNIIGAVLNGLFSADWGGGGATPADPPILGYAPMPTVYGAGETNVMVYAGLQSVVDSTGSFTLEVRAVFQDFGITLRGSTFFESGEMPGAETLRLDLGTLGGQYRVIRGELTSLWLEAGAAYVSTYDNLSIFGIMGGVRLERQITGEVAVSVGAHAYLMQDRVNILEARATFHVSILRLSYRVVDFNVGPPLHGPEVGVGLTF